MPAVRGIGMEAKDTPNLVGSGGVRLWGAKVTWSSDSLMHLEGLMRVPMCVSAWGLDSIFQVVLFPHPLSGRRL